MSGPMQPGREPWRFIFVAEQPISGWYGLLRSDAQEHPVPLPAHAVPLYLDVQLDDQRGSPSTRRSFFNYYNDNNTLLVERIRFPLRVIPCWPAPDLHARRHDTRRLPPVARRLVLLPHRYKYAGGQTVTVNAPLGTLPCSCAEARLFQWGHPCRYANQFQPGYLDVNCWPDGIRHSRSTKMRGDGWTTRTECTR